VGVVVPADAVVVAPVLAKGAVKVVVMIIALPAV